MSDDDRIRFEEKDSNPYSVIMIYEGDVLVASMMVAFSLDCFMEWLDARDFPRTVEEAKSRLDEYSSQIDRSARYVRQQMEAARRKREAWENRDYDERYEELRRLGYDDRKIHMKLFPEEYDYMLDDHVDAGLRAQGVNPMSAGYLARINRRRMAAGFPPVPLEGPCHETMEWCRKHRRRTKDEP